MAVDLVDRYRIELWLAWYCKQYCNHRVLSIKIAPADTEMICVRVKRIHSLLRLFSDEIQSAVDESVYHPTHAPYKKRGREPDLGVRAGGSERLLLTSSHSHATSDNIFPEKKEQILR